MKKFLSLLLALALAFSCFGVMSFAEDEDDVRPDCVAAVIDPIISSVNSAFADSINEIGYDSVNEIAETGSITDLDTFIQTNSSDSMFGVTLSDLYGDAETPFVWSNFRVCMVEVDDHRGTDCSFKEAYDECAAVLLGNRIEYEGKDKDLALFEKINEVKITVGENKGHYNYYFVLGKGELSLVRANINLYLKRIISNYWGGGRFYTNENIVNITNFIGTLINPHFILLPEDSRPFDDNVRMDTYTFFGKIVELSGLGALIDSNWCKQRDIDFIPLMAALGVQTDSLLTGEKEEGYYVGRRLLTDMFSEFFAAPLTYVLKVIWSFSKEYTVTYQPAFRALFTMRASQVGNQYTEESLSTVTGAFNFLSDAVDSVNNKISGDRIGNNLTFAELPARRFALALDHDELFLMVLCYLDINRVYQKAPKTVGGVTTVYAPNEIAIENLWISFENAARSTLTGEEMATVKSFFKNFVQGELTMSGFLNDMLTTITDTNMGQIENDLWNSLRVSISNLLQKIISAIDNFVRILLGEKDPFERI